MICTACIYHITPNQIRILAFCAQKIRSCLYLETWLWWSKSNPNSSIHQDIGPCFDLESFHYMQASLTNLKHAQNLAETAIPIWEKSLKSVRSKTILEALSDQNHNTTLFLGIHWSNTNQNQVLRQPKTRCKCSWKRLCTWNREPLSLHLFANWFAHSYSPSNLHWFCII